MGTLVYSNHFKFAVAGGSIDLDTDTIKIALMGTGFTFDVDTHATYADVSASELSTGFGYTATGLTLTTPLITEDDTNDRANITYADAVWTASGGSIGPAAGAIIYDDTTGDDTIICYDPFASDLTATDTNTLTISSIELRVS